ncbi:hypothetical protein [Corynebacterium sanguinis]|uniref:hypothetical protein n=1 Tax=Corynebacterium sanguinis TaxID=2594913 RepID=UPI00223B726A|nr:hypothetical protein [Corynebacterium sanguinis]MCT1414653.1 hypothetical protein [Corynebacterium sanguinis]
MHADEASVAFGFGGIFLLMGAFFLSFVLVPVFTFVGLRLVMADGREQRISGAVVLALQAATVAIALCCYFSVV